MVLCAYHRVYTVQEFMEFAHTARLSGYDIVINYIRGTEAWEIWVDCLPEGLPDGIQGHWYPRLAPQP